MKNKARLLFFGFKYFSKGNIHEVADWGNLEKFLAQALTEAYEKGYREGIVENTIALDKKMLEAFKTAKIGDVTSELIESIRKEGHDKGREEGYHAGDSLLFVIQISPNTAPGLLMRLRRR